ncbi:hypothetical protein AB6A40_003864 [Gnathostoma spinigerum]|uniref:Uncharacterized protein n=1 Tax=Gnathostoma spinigerum TaxID=75299 RepID=A0ABD6EBY4_9BILA
MEMHFSIFECALCRRPCSSSVKLAKNYIVDAIIQSVIDIGNDGSVPVLDDNLLFINKRLNKELRDAERLNLELHESLEREKNLKDLAILCICGIVSSVFIIYWWC